MSKSNRHFYCTCQIKHKHSSNGKMTEQRHPQVSSDGSR